MKIFLFVFIITTTIFAQAVYEVVPGTIGNTIVLSIVNESESYSADKITVSLSSDPKGIEVCNKLVELQKLNTREEVEAIFNFDAKRIPGIPKDTLKFLIRDNNGAIWKKEIVIEYSLPKEFKLEQNYPNPFNPSTTIEYIIPEKGNYLLQVYNVLGQLTQTLYDDLCEARYYKINFDGRNLASGIYIYKLSGNNINISRKMILMK